MRAEMKKNANNKGFSLIELLIGMTLMLVLMGLATTLFANALGIRSRESRKVDALASARAALSSISREVSNCGYGMTINSPIAKIKSNGLVVADSGAQKIRCRANLNNNETIDVAGEDVTYFFDSATQSIVRYDPHAETPTSVIVNRISEVQFEYYDYNGVNLNPVTPSAPVNTTGRVTITVTVRLEDVQGQPSNQTVAFTSDVTLRNSKFMLEQY